MSIETSNKTVKPESFVIEIGTTLHEVERELIYATLAVCDHNKMAAAKMLGISVKTIYNKLNAYAKPVKSKR